MRPQPSRAFGALESNTRVIGLVSGRSEPASVRWQFDPASGESPAVGSVFAHYWLYRYATDDLPISIESWMPYRARIESAVPAWLETPRMWLADYTATVDGAATEVRQSPDGLAMVAVPAGSSTVVLEYRVPAVLTLVFWASFAAWCALLFAALRAGRRYLSMAGIQQPVSPLQPDPPAGPGSFRKIADPSSSRR